MNASSPIASAAKLASKLQFLSLNLNFFATHRSEGHRPASTLRQIDKRRSLTILTILGLSPIFLGCTDIPSPPLSDGGGGSGNKPNTYHFAPRPAALRCFANAFAGPDADGGLPDAGLPAGSTDAGAPQLGQVLYPQGYAPKLLSESGCFDSLKPLVPSSELMPYGLLVPLWTDGAEKSRFMAVAPGQSIELTEDGGFQFPPGSVIIKHFGISNGSTHTLKETRVMLRREGNWDYYSYKWRPDQSDADLLSTYEYELIDLEHPIGDASQINYLYPDPYSCRACHGFVEERGPLGPRLNQFNFEYTYPDGRSANQLSALIEAKILDASVWDHPMIQPLPRIDDTSASETDRALAYLHGNCGHCHQKDGWVPPDLKFSLHYRSDWLDSKLCDQESLYTARSDAYVVPGNPERSAIYRRISSQGPSRMPLLGISVADPDGVELIRSWITNLKDCPE